MNRSRSRPPRWTRGSRREPWIGRTCGILSSSTPRASKRTARAAEQVILRQRELQNQTVALLEARWKAGEASLVEVQLVRIAASQAALDLDDVRRQSVQARVRLADAIGLPVQMIGDRAVSF